MLCRDNESNPSPGTNSGQSYSICHWNLNSIATHNFSKISLLKAYNEIHTYDIMYLSETYLNHETLFDDDNLRIVRVDHPSNQRQDGVYIYLKDSLPKKVNNLSYMKEFFNFNMSADEKQFHVTLIYR